MFVGIMDFIINWVNGDNSYMKSPTLTHLVVIANGLKVGQEWPAKPTNINYRAIYYFP